MKRRGGALLLLACIFTVSLSACRNSGYASADNRVLWDTQGCAFFIQPNVGDTSFVTRLPDADRPECFMGGM